MTGEQALYKAIETAITSHSSPNIDLGDGHGARGQPGWTVWESSLPFVNGALLEELRALGFVVAPKDFYYHEVAYVRGLEASTAEKLDCIREQDKMIREIQRELANSQKLLGDGVLIIAERDAIIAEQTKALENIAGGFINSSFVISTPPNWHSAFNQLQELARTALKLAEPK